MTTDHTPMKTPPSPEAVPRRRRSWLPMLFWLLVAGGVGGAVWHDPGLVDKARAFVSPPAPAVKGLAARVVPVTAVEARQADMDLFLNGLGSVNAFNTVTVRSRVEGELLRVAFTEGQAVEQGDLLAEIDPRSFEVELTQAEAQLARDEAALKATELDLERYESLADLKQITGQQIDAQRAIVRQAEAAVRITEALRENAQLRLTYCRIEAPIGGRIGLRLVDAGNMVRANDSAGLALIAQIHPIAVTFTIPQDEIVRVQRALAETGTLPVEAFNRDFQTRLATGTLSAIDNQVDPATGTVKLKAVFPNDDDALFPNQFVNARLLVETLHDTTLVPLAALQRGPDSAFLYVVQADSTVALRTVQPGQVQGDQVAITSGLEPGELVVTDGIDKLTNKAKVAVRGLKPPAAAEGKPAVEGRTAGP
ncbi:MAG: MdtA/MuxA family multidrug efflux RND transporter periplasmic adaptor subunit [Planctomycetota bacterium]|nr:MAG: MdtA/MuxA family multidrug efflux RND transporter periplasmic adaptor subunit [Planctomycetota bacterium]